MTTLKPANKQPLPLNGDTAYTPNNASNISCRIQRQISRVIKHLRNQANIEAPHLPMPTKWLINQLVANALAHKTFNLNVHRWDDMVLETLQQIQQDTALADGCHYKVMHTKTPLFPNDELLDEWEIHQFVSYLIDYSEDNNAG